MVFVGSGGDEAEIRAEAERLELGQKCVFTGPVRDREKLRGWYSRADLLLFPSTFDTNGLGVREAAACGLPALLLRDGCAAEGVVLLKNEGGALPMKPVTNISPRNARRSAASFRFVIFSRKQMAESTMTNAGAV